MKKISYLFLTLAMVITAGMMLTSCSEEDNPSATSEAEVKARLLGTWYSQYDATGTINDKTYKSVVEVYQFPEILSESGIGIWNRFFFAEAGDEKPFADLGGGSGATGVFSYTVNSNGMVGLKLEHLDLATLDQSYYAPTERSLQLSSGKLLATGVSGTPISLSLANDTKEAELEGWRLYLNGGSDGGGEVAVGHPFSESVVGEIVGSDGQAYAVADKDRLPEGVSAVAMVAYRSETRGLAIQLVSEVPEQKTWDEAKNYVKDLAPVPGAQWFIPSRTDWHDMLFACDNKAVDTTSGIGNAFEFYHKMIQTGIYKFQFVFKCWLNEGPEALPTVVGLGDVLGVASFESAANPTYSCIACLMFLEGHPLSKSAVGEIVGSDGLAYAVADKDYVPYGVSAAAMVAHKDDTSGLAIALTDEPEDMDWSTANGPGGAAAHTPAVAGQTWKLPSLDEFRQMFISNGGDALQSWVLNRNLTLAGGTPLKESLQDNAGYWMSSEWEGDVASHMRHYDSRVGYNRVSKDIVSSVRACFAF